jgi:hypothetical protein
VPKYDQLTGTQYGIIERDHGDSIAIYDREPFACRIAGHGRRLCFTVKAAYDTAVLKARLQLGPDMDDLAVRQVNQFWVPIERQNIAPSARQNCSNWLVKFEGSKAGSVGHIVYNQTMPTRTRFGVILLDAILSRLGRGRHCDAIIVEPTGRAFLSQVRVERTRQFIAAVEVMRIGEGFRNIKAYHET